LRWRCTRRGSEDVGPHDSINVGHERHRRGDDRRESGVDDRREACV
jgi:hypothetical protein